MVDIVALQRAKIGELELQLKGERLASLDQRLINIGLIDIITYLTDERFREFASKDNWGKVVEIFLEE